MRIENPDIGPIELGEDAIVRIVGGLIGFEGLERYFLFMTEASDPFLWLQSADETSLFFVVVDPEPFLREPCDLVITDADRHALDLHPDEPVEVFALVSPPERGGRITMNLKGPIIVNPRNRVGKQLVAYSSKQPLRVPITQPLTAGSKVGRTAVRIIDRRAA